MAQTRALLFIEFQNTSLSCTHKRRIRNLSLTWILSAFRTTDNAGEYLMEISRRKSSVSATASPQLPRATGTAYFYTFFTWVYWHWTNYRIHRLSRKWFNEAGVETSTTKLSKPSLNLLTAKPHQPHTLLEKGIRLLLMGIYQFSFDQTGSLIINLFIFCHETLKKRGATTVAGQIQKSLSTS